MHPNHPTPATPAGRAAPDAAPGTPPATPEDAPATAAVSAPGAAPASAAAAPDGLPAGVHTLRHFLSFSGTRLPLNFTGELAGDALRHRNTFWRAGYDAQGRMRFAEQCVYGEVALRHDYHWHASGRLAEAVVQVPDEDPQHLRFDDDQPVT